jgi:hypothetical protein
MNPELRSEWFAVPQDAQQHVVIQAMQYYRKIGLMTEENKPVLRTVGTAVEQLRPSSMNPSACEAIVIARQEDYYDGPWIEMSNNALYCTLCETWADAEHLNSWSHRKARCDVQRREVGEERKPWTQIEYGGEQPVMPFGALHNVNLSLEGAWPAKMRLLRIKLAHVVAGALGMDYGILIAPSADEENSVYFGLSLEWCRGTEYHGMARLKPESVKWQEERRKIGGGGEAELKKDADPEELIRKYHEAVLHKVLPNMRATVAERLPAAGLLVRLISQDTDSVELFAWAEMQRVVDEGDERDTEQLLLESIIEEEDVDGEAADGSHSALHGDVVVHDIFRASAGPLTEMVVADAPFWLVPLLHRWYRLHDFESAAMNLGLVFPVLSPLVLESVLTMPSTGNQFLLQRCFARCWRHLY